MITPKFRELMLAAETKQWTLRFWFSGSLQSPERIDVVERIRYHVLRELPEIHGGVEEIILRETQPSHGLAAYEILDTNRNGVVGYVEWP